MATIAKFLSDTGWLAISRMIHLPVNETKMLMHRQYAMQERGQLELLRPERNFCDAWNYYLDHKNILDD